MYRSLVHPQNRSESWNGNEEKLDEFITKNKLAELLHPFSGLVMQLAETNEANQIPENSLLLEELLEELVKQVDEGHLEELKMSLAQYRKMLHKALSVFHIPMARDSAYLLKCVFDSGSGSRVA